MGGRGEQTHRLRQGDREEVERPKRRPSVVQRQTWRGLEERGRGRSKQRGRCRDKWVDKRQEPEVRLGMWA